MGRWAKLVSAKRKKGLAIVLAVLLALPLLWFLLQGPFAHRRQPFAPTYEKLDLAPVLEKETALTAEDYQTLYTQTGLGPAAVDDLRAQGAQGVRQILDTQDAFFSVPCNSSCAPLGVTTREHRYLDEEGRMVYAAPLAPLKEGDVFVALSTHTVGWTHGHAGLVLDPSPKRPVTLESVVLGEPSCAMNANHWRSYTSWMVLRPKADDATRHQVVELAREKLTDVPYSLVSGVFGDKFQPLDGPHDTHCGYLPWYAWMAVGIDLDGDGGRVVAPEDLTLSENMEVVQVYGMDPADYPLALETAS